MEPSAPARPSPTSQNFAGFLASLASPAHVPPTEELEWATGELSEGVALLSYEQALHAHTRCRPTEREDLPPVEASGAANPWAVSNEPESLPGEELPVAADPIQHDSADRNLRSASVTIRVSQAECARLRRRSTEAGLTVSAYLRSCALEAETLRAQVKHALAEIKAGIDGAKQQANKPASDLRSTESNLPAKNAVMIDRVLGHIGKLWFGFSAGRAS